MRICMQETTCFQCPSKQVEQQYQKYDFHW